MKKAGKGVEANIITKERDKMEKEIDAEYIDGNHASYYGGEDDPYEAIKVINAWSEKNKWDGKQGFTYGTVLRYLSRAGQKAGNSEAQDIQKCINYLQMRLNNLK